MQTSPVNVPPQRVEYAAWRHEPLVLTQVLDAVSAVNSQLLDSLAECARGDAAEFPLNDSLRSRVAGLTLEERRRAARCGVFLADANCVDFSCWREVMLRGESALPREILRPWLPIEESRSLAHSVLLIVWYVVHASPAVARVLLGMSASGVTAFRELDVGEIAQIARRRPDCVRPRWPNRLDVWTQIVEGARDAGAESPRWTTLRCLQVSARDLKWRSAYMELSA
jgi:hypothetical protein